MAGSPRPASRRPFGRGLRVALVAAATVAAAALARARADEAADAPLDPLQRAVVDSLQSAPRTTPEALLEAAVRAADIGAVAAASDWFGKLSEALDGAGDRRPEALADLGDSPAAEGLGRVERLLAPRAPAAVELVREIRQAARDRRRDPDRLAAAVAELRSPHPEERAAAVERLVQGHVDALPVLVPLLQSAAPAEAGLRDTARRIIGMLGEDARQPLLSWLASDDVDSWPGICEALDASGAADVDLAMVAPAIVGDLPADVRQAAAEVLRRRADRRAAADRPLQAVPDRATAERLLADRLDRVLSPEGLPEPDCLLLEPIRDPAQAAAAFGGGLEGLVERPVWNPTTRRFDRRSMPPRTARAFDAAHLARDLAAIGPREPRSLARVLLAQEERLLVERGAALDVPPADLRKALAGPDGFTADVTADVLDAAVTHGLWEAAAGAAAALPPPRDADPPVRLAPHLRKALVRTLEVPNSAVQFAAARTLALAAGPPPFAGSSRVLDVLLHAATARGVDRAVVAHPDSAVVDALATGISRFGYEPVRVSTGREAVFSARATADTALVMVAARINTPSAYETVQYLQRQPLGDVPPVLVVVDPLDDDARGRFLSRLIADFSGVHGVTLVDRLDSFFAPTLDARTGDDAAAARFPDALAQAVGPRSVDPAARAAARSQRLARGREALRLLADMSQRGWDVRPASATALDALSTAELYAPAVRLLAVLGRPEAQAALAAEAERADLPDGLRGAAVEAFAASVAGHGVLLDCGHLRSIAARYNPAHAPSRAASGDVLDVLEAAGRPHRLTPRDAPPPRPTP